MAHHVYTFAQGAAVMAMLLCAMPAGAQSQEGNGTDQDRKEPPKKLQILLGTQAILHSVDMFTTVRNLQFSGAREGNPLLAPFARHPPALVTLSSGVDALQMYTITRLHRRHPKLAMAWAAILVGTEAFVVANNVRVAGQLERAGGGAP